MRAEWDGVGQDDERDSPCRKTSGNNMQSRAIYASANLEAEQARQATAVETARERMRAKHE